MEIVVFWLICAIVVGVIASSRGRSGFGWFILAVLFSPLLMGILVLALGRPKKEAEIAQQQATAMPRTVEPGPGETRCPECREVIRSDARKCKHCGSSLVAGAIAS